MSYITELISRDTPDEIKTMGDEFKWHNFLIYLPLLVILNAVSKTLFFKSSSLLSLQVLRHLKGQPGKSALEGFGFLSIRSVQVHIPSRV